MRLGDLIRETRLALAGSAEPEIDARILVEHFTGTTRTDALTRPDMEVGEHEVAGLRAAIARRAAGEPVHRIIGRREFYGLELWLSPATLEPRPDTEILVDRLVPHLRKIARSYGTCRILDLGTGTGAIALALLREVQGTTAVGADVAPEAVETAMANAVRNGLADRFTGIVSDWFSDVTGKFHAIVSNPPYISTQEMSELSRDVRDFDPERALHGGVDGLDAYRAIAAGAAARLEDDGIVAVEIGYSQRGDVNDTFEAAGYQLLESAKDLAGHDRALLFRRSR